jgi:hypothetical protein
MKKTLLTAGLLALTFGAFAQFVPNTVTQFTKGNLVVLQYGADGRATALDVNAVDLYIKEYTPTVANQAAAVSLLALPPETVTGTNALTGKGNGGNEGLLTLSPNGKYLTLFGYGDKAGTAVVTSTNKTIGMIDKNGAINTSTTIPTTNSPRSAVTTDGTGFWFVYSAEGVRYAPIGGTTTNTPVSTVSSYVARSLDIFNGQLYEFTNSSKAAHVGKVGTGLPVTNLDGMGVQDNAANPITPLPGTSTTTVVNNVSTTVEAIAVANQVALVKSTQGVGEPDIFYVANDQTTPRQIEKWMLVSGVWTFKGANTSQGLTRGITARVINGVAHIYAVTAGSLVEFIDAETNPATATSATFAALVATTLATAPANTQFKGVAFTPSTVVADVTLPIKLSSFTGKSELNGAQLSWTTSSEKNNNHFEVLRSTDGTQFSKIGQVAGSGNSDAALNYSFLDRNAVIGANYYKLNQVDNNGTSEEFGPVVVTVNGQAAAISVYANKASGQINVNVFANKGGEGVLNVYDAGGKVVAKQNVSLQAGNNQISLNSQNAGAGLHIASLTFAGETLTKKFIFQ